ncbi:hypothetical protein BDR04DRAFT_1106151, partial [Suillus decipiens]
MKSCLVAHISLWILNNGHFSCGCCKIVHTGIGRLNCMGPITSNRSTDEWLDRDGVGYQVAFLCKRIINITALCYV